MYQTPQKRISGMLGTKFIMLHPLPRYTTLPDRTLTALLVMWKWRRQVVAVSSRPTKKPTLVRVKSCLGYKEMDPQNLPPYDSTMNRGLDIASMVMSMALLAIASFLVLPSHHLQLCLLAICSAVIPPNILETEASKCRQCVVPWSCASIRLVEKPTTIASSWPSSYHAVPHARNPAPTEVGRLDTWIVFLSI